MFRSLLLVAMCFSVAAANSQAVQYKNGKNLKYWISASGSTDCHVPFKNVTGNSAKIVYKKVSVDWPSQWLIQFCDDMNCFNDFVDNDTFQTLASNAESEMKIGVIPQGHADTGTVVYYMYADNNPAVRDTFTATIYIQWGASLQIPAVNPVKISPNPVNNQLIFTSTIAGAASVRDIRGAVVAELAVNTGSNEIPMAALPSGIYYLTVSTPKGVVTEKIIKN